MPSLVDIATPVRSRGPVSESLLETLARDPAEPTSLIRPGDDDPLSGEDEPVALYLCYELAYRGIPGVDDAWEWDPRLVEFRALLEARLLAKLTAAFWRAPRPPSLHEGLLALTRSGGPSLSSFVADTASLDQIRELAVHRSMYQLKEADPHSWAIPRLEGRAKAALVSIQFEEYGDGVAAAMHSSLFATTMRRLALDDTYGAYLDHVPGVTLTATNLISLFGLHRRHRGALVGHLALFEMTSTGPNLRYGEGLRRLGLGRDATEFYDTHVAADASHEVIAIEDLVGGLVEREPFLEGDVLFGAFCLSFVEARFTAHVLDAWSSGRTSLRRPLDTPAGSAPQTLAMFANRA